VQRAKEESSVDSTPTTVFGTVWARMGEEQAMNNGTGNTTIEVGIEDFLDGVKLISADAKAWVCRQKFEDEDAIVFVYVPENMIKTVQEEADRLAMRILLKQDIDIAVLVRSSALLNRSRVEDVNKVVIKTVA
jgi:hypothetical protein